ncbi:MAG: protein kinase domain-containing protein [Myxococcota bacterium]
MPAKHRQKGSPVHEAEAKGQRALIAALPENYTVYTNLELGTGQRGQTYEHDAIVVAPHAVFTVELKSWGGTITGNRDRWTLADGAFVQSPLPLILAKARSLKGRLTAMRRDFVDIWVQGLVYLSAGDAVPHITPDFADLVCTSRDIAAAITTPGAWGNGRLLTPGQITAVHQLLNDGKANRAPEQINGFHLAQRLAAEDRPYEAWLARRNGETRVLHVHTVTGDDAGERDRSRNHALREATLHEKLRGGPDVLGYRDYFQTADDPQRIVLVFDDTTPLVPSDAWVRDRNPGLVARLRVAVRSARALAWVHARGLVHRRLSPESILVSGSTAEAPETVRLSGFDLARDLAAVSPTITGTSLGDPSYRCSAPEALKTGEASARSDLFSLGATLYELFAGRPLFATPDAVLRPFSVTPFDLGGRPVPEDLLEALRQLLSPEPAKRPASADDTADALDAVIARLTETPRKVVHEPGRELRGLYRLNRRIDRGATGTIWLADHLLGGPPVVLKIAGVEHARMLQDEYAVGQAVQHPCLVRVQAIDHEDGFTFLVLNYIEAETATLWAAAGDPLDPARFRRVADGLFGALGAMHDAGYLHRDVKPDNVLIREPDASPTLIDLGLAARVDAEGGLAVGTVQYKDPLVYAEGCWTPANDQYAAFMVLYELLTGTHPFGSAAPDGGQLPTIEPDQFPDSFSPAIGKALAHVFAAALAPNRAARPANLRVALEAIDDALGRSSKAKAVPTFERKVPGDALPDSPLAVLSLSTRAQGALARLAVVAVGGLAGVSADLLRRLPNVGGKTTRELLEWSELVRERWPSLPTDAPAALHRFYPPLAADERPLGSVDLGLTASHRAAFAERGIRTVGDLARLPVVALAGLPNFTPERQEATRRHLALLAGRDPGLDSLGALDEALRRDIGDRAHDAIAAVVGLRDGQTRSLADAGDLLGVTRQRVGQLVEIDELRKPGSTGHWFAALVEDLLPATGFSSVEDVAAAIENRLPTRDASRVSSIGYARFAGLLLQSDARTVEAGDVAVVCRGPWTQETVEASAGALATLAAWPPVPRKAAEVALWDALSEELERALVRWGADAASLLDALLRLAPEVCVDRLGGLYTPPVPLRGALAQLRPVGRVVASAQEILADARATWEGLEESTPLDEALVQAGYVRDGDRWVDPARAEIAAEPVEAVVDAAVPRQRAGPGAAVVGSLLAQADRGGFRVVAMRPGEAHHLGRDLASWLADELGAARVRFVDLDRVVIDALKEADLWKFVPAFEANPKADWQWIGADVRAVLADVVAEAKPGLVTVIGKPALLGTLGLMDWLGGFYERARGGAHGLVVLTVPGGVHDDRVRLNETYNLPCTPDMAAVFLEGT